MTTTVVSDPAELGRYEITAEILGAAAGPKINMILYKNKTGYRRRLGHRQKYTQVRITGISGGGKSAKSSASRPAAAKASTAKAARRRPSTAKASTAKASTAKARPSTAKARASSGKKG